MTYSDVLHLGLKYSDICGSNIAIIPGDPNRVKKIAYFMNNPIHLSTNREFTIWSAEIYNKKIIICSTGIGGPSTSIVVEELSQLGIKIFLRVGTTGSIQKYIKEGDIIITNASIRMDGASQHFAPLCFPAVSDFFCTKALITSAQKNNSTFHIGITASSDTFYPGQERYNTYSGKIIKSLKGSMKEWQSMGVMNYEMESATLFTICACNGLKAGMISGVIVNRLKKEIPDISIIKNTEFNVIKIAVNSINLLK